MYVVPHTPHATRHTRHPGRPPPLGGVVLYCIWMAGRVECVVIVHNPGQKRLPVVAVYGNPMLAPSVSRGLTGCCLAARACVTNIYIYISTPPPPHLILILPTCRPSACALIRMRVQQQRCNDASATTCDAMEGWMVSVLLQYVTPHTPTSSYIMMGQ